jgi:RNA ligase (TIGR02306 family)
MTSPHFCVRVERVHLSAHPDADALELAWRDPDQLGHCAVVRKGSLRPGQTVAWIPEHAVLPGPVLDELGLRGKLAGPAGDRVKAVRLRGVLSRGLCLPGRPHWSVGDDVTAELGITRHVVPVPVHMAGSAWSAGLARTLSYDIEDIGRYPGVLQSGEPVSLTEKLHGTWCLVGLMPPRLAHPEQGALVVASKGLSAKGLALQVGAPENRNNLYLRAVRAWELEARLRAWVGERDAPVFLLGEVFGAGVQDLGYGQSRTGGAPPGFRAFDLRIGGREDGRYLGDRELERALHRLGVPRVPVLHRGPFDRAVLAAHTRGCETVSGRELHLREGVVVRPLVERRHALLGRVQLKSINPAYLTRRGGTEHS